LARTAEVAGTNLGGLGIGRVEHHTAVTGSRSSYGRDNVLENIAFHQDTSTLFDFKGMPAGIEPVLVDRMQGNLASRANLRRSPRGIADKIILKSNLVVGTEEQHSPTVIAVARRGPRCLAIHVAV
jgi:hypothetical protein